jgi:hypothetical protein
MHRWTATWFRRRLRGLRPPMDGQREGERPESSVRPSTCSSGFCGSVSTREPYVATERSVRRRVVWSMISARARVHTITTDRYRSITVKDRAARLTNKDGGIDRRNLPNQWSFLSTSHFSCRLRSAIWRMCISLPFLCGKLPYYLELL